MRERLPKESSLIISVIIDSGLLPALKISAALIQQPGYGNLDDFDMNITDTIIALVRGLETVIVTVAECLQCGVVGESNDQRFVSSVFSGEHLVAIRELLKFMTHPHSTEMPWRPIILIM